MALLPPAERQELLTAISPKQRALALRKWRFWPARAEQLPPKGDWRIWLFLGGRGSGKTRAGAEWVADGVRCGRFRRIGLIGATAHDARSVMVEGESGLLLVGLCHRIAFVGM